MFLRSVTLTLIACFVCEFFPAAARDNMTKLCEKLDALLSEYEDTKDEELERILDSFMTRGNSQYCRASKIYQAKYVRGGRSSSMEVDDLGNGRIVSLTEQELAILLNATRPDLTELPADLPSRLERLEREVGVAPQ